jgi:hypothetical protein
VRIPDQDQAGGAYRGFVNPTKGLDWAWPKNKPVDTGFWLCRVSTSQIVKNADFVALPVAPTM